MRILPVEWKLWINDSYWNSSACLRSIFVDWIIWRRTGEKHRCMLSTVCHRQSKQPPKPADVYVEHAYKLRHVVLVCAHNALICVCFVFCLFFSFFPLGRWGKTLNEVVYFHDWRMHKGLKTICARLAVWTLPKFNWGLSLKFYFCCAHLRSYIIQ